MKRHGWLPATLLAGRQVVAGAAVPPVRRNARPAMSVQPDTLVAMTPTHLDLDDVVAVATIVEAMLERPMTPNESSRLKFAYQRGRTLTQLAAALAA